MGFKPDGDSSTESAAGSFQLFGGFTFYNNGCKIADISSRSYKHNNSNS